MRLALWMTMGFGMAGLAGCNRPAAAELPSQDVTAEVSAPVAQRPREAQPAETALEEFRFPDDRAGRLLARLLQPQTRIAFYSADVAAPRRASPSAIDQPSAPLLPAQTPPVRLRLDKGPGPLRPGPLPGEVVPNGLIDTRLPERIHLPAGDRVRLPSPDITSPAPLPLVGQAVTDRVSLDDPTADLSLSAALTAPAPKRTQPAPFIRLSVPDPFENRKLVQRRDEPVEEMIAPIVPAVPTKKWTTTGRSDGSPRPAMLRDLMSRTPSPYTKRGNRSSLRWRAWPRP
jgi:hypothetical protein